MAASLVVVLPVVIVFFPAQRLFIRGIATTGMKGQGRRRQEAIKVMDVQMLKMDELEASRRTVPARQRAALAWLASASHHRHDRGCNPRRPGAVLGADMDDYLSKPIRVEFDTRVGVGARYSIIEVSREE
jgi:hypothetical protein